MHKAGIILVFAGTMALLAACGGTAGAPAATPAVSPQESPTGTVVQPATPSAQPATPSPTTIATAAPTLPPTGTPILPTATATALPTEPPPAASPTPPELTYEENVKYTPPPPLNIQASAGAQAITITWSPPPPVSVPHVYSDVVDHYNVYRSQDGGEFALLGSTSATSFTDDGSSQPLVAGAIYRYFVTALHEGEVESAQSERVTITFQP